MSVSWVIHHKETTASTNKDARGAKPWEVFTASFQTAGRGRLDHTWVSSRDLNLMMSAVLPVEGLPPDHVATLPLAVGLAVAKALSKWAQEECLVKWPNDVFVGGRKIAGILCERDSDNVIVGIGVNVGQEIFPPEVADRAVSLALLPNLASCPSVAEVRDEVLSYIEIVYNDWNSGGFQTIYETLSKIDMLRGRSVEVVQTDDDKKPFVGVCGGIAKDGSLDIGGNFFYAGEVHVSSVKI